MKTIFALALALVLAIGCSQKKALDQSAQAQSITVKRGPCFGSCPIYNATVARNGKVDFEGIRFIEPEGNLSFTLSEKDNAKFWKLADRIDYTAYDTLYPCKIADLPSSTFVFENEKTQKTITYQCEPDEVFIKLLDEVSMLLGQYLPKEIAE